MFAVLGRQVLAQSANSFLTGDIMTDTNNTTGNGAWSDPVNGNPGEIIEFRIVAQNQTAGVTASNVIVTASLPGNPSTTLSASGNVSAAGFTTTSDTATVNVLGGSQQSLVYVPGHARVFSPSCPSGCAAGDSVTSSGINVGDLGPGESAQILFKAGITNVVVASPSPSPSPSPTPSPSPSPSPSPTPSPAAAAAAGGQSQSQSQSVSVTQNVTQTNNQTVNAVPAKQLPKTGLPLLSWVGASFLPLGFGLKKFGKQVKNEMENDPKYIWEKRQYKL